MLEPTRFADPLTIAMMIETVALGGAEMVVLQLANELRARGHSVLPVVPAGREGWLLDQFRDAGLRWEVYELRRPIDAGLPGRMAHMLRANGIRLVHSHEFVMAVYGQAACDRARLPHVITMHGNQDMTKRFRRRVALRWAFRRSHATVAVSQDTRRHLESSLGLRSGIVQVIPNGVPSRAGDRHRVRREHSIARDELLILAVGSLTLRKGHSLLIRALAELHKDDLASWRLMIAGEGDEYERLGATIETEGLRDRVRLLGPRNDVPDLLAAADVFVMPSLWEGLPLAVIEAMLAGKPIVASRTSGIPEAITHERDGLLVEPGDTHSLAAALRRVMSDADLRLMLGGNARRRAHSEFTIAAMTDRYEDLYVAVGTRA